MYKQLLYYTQNVHVRTIKYLLPVFQCHQNRYCYMWKRKLSVTSGTWLSSYNFTQCSSHCTANDPHETTSIHAHVHMWHGTQSGCEVGGELCARDTACYAVCVSGCCNVSGTGATAPKSQESFRGARAPCAPLVPPPMQ